MGEAYVIGIAAPAGGGKSTLLDALHARMPDAAALRFDDYEVALPTNWEAWLADGARFDDWEVPALHADLFEMKRAESPFRWLLFEAPLGRAHAATGELIDFVVFIDTPLEVALSRWVKRRLAAEEPNPAFVAGYLAMYEAVLRNIYLEQRRQVRASADLVLDGLDPVDTWVDQVVKALPASRLQGD